MTAGTGTKTKHWQAWLIACLVTAFCLLLGMSVLDLGQSARGLASIGPTAWLAVIALSLFMALLRALRVMMIARVTQAAPVFKASFLHGAANAVLPARLGEAVLPVALARFSGLDPLRAVGLLLIVRLGDLLVLIGLGMVMISRADFRINADIDRPLLLIGGVILIAAVVFVPAIIGRFGRWSPVVVRVLTDRLAAAGSMLAGKDRLSLVAVTLAIWLTLGLAAFVSVSAAGLQVGLADAILAAVAASLAFALPTNGIASIGPFEAAFVAVLVMAGAPAEPALTAAIHLHLCALIAAGLAGLAAVTLPAFRGVELPCS